MKKTVALLLVDDDRDFLEVLERRFSRRGMAVTICTDATSAGRVARRVRFDVAIVDRRLRGECGLQLIRDLKQLDNEPQVIMLSGRSDDDSKDEALQAGACEYLIKPSSLSELEAAVERACPSLVV